MNGILLEVWIGWLVWFTCSMSYDRGKIQGNWGKKCECGVGYGDIYAKGNNGGYRSGEVRER